MNFTHIGGKHCIILFIHFFKIRGWVTNLPKQLFKLGGHCFEKKIAMHARFISDFTVREGAKTPRRGWCAKFGEGGDFIYKNFLEV